MSPPRAPSTPAVHPLALVRSRLRDSGLQRWLLLPLGDLAPKLFRYSRRGARLAERLAGDRPALTVSSALAELSGQVQQGAKGTPLPRILIDKLAYALHRFVDDEGERPPPVDFTFGEGIVPGPVVGDLRPLLTAVEALMGRLEAEGVSPEALMSLRRQRSRVTIDEGPPAGFFFSDDPRPVPAGMLLAIDGDGYDGGLAFVGVRGPLMSTTAQWYAADRIKDIIVEPLYDEAPRLRRLGGGRFGALLAALDDLVIVDEQRERLVWRVLVDKGVALPVIRGGGGGDAPLDVGRGPQQLDRIERGVRGVDVANDDDVAFAALQRQRGRLDGISARALLEHPFVEDQSGQPLRVVEGRLRLDLDDEGHLSLSGLGCPVRAQDIADDGAAAVHDAAGRRLVVVAADQRERALAKVVVQLRGAALPPQVLAAVAQKMKRARVEVALPAALRGERVAPSTALALKVAFRAHSADGASDPFGAGARFAIVAHPLAGGPSFTPGEGPAVAFADSGEAGAPRWCERDFAHEKETARRILAVADVPDEGMDGAWSFQVLNPQRAIETFLRLAERHDVVPYVAEDAVTVVRAKAKGLKVEFSEKRDWLGVDGGVEIGDDERVALRVLIDALRAGRRYVQLDGGRLLLLEDALRERLSPLAALAQNEKGGGLRLARAAGLAIAAGAGNDDDDGHVAFDVSALVGAIDDVRAQDDAPADGISATLRPYQREGLRFLRRLTAMGTGGVLADDMGLGKTLTSICLLHDRGPKGPQLVVAPTSLSHHWARETARFSDRLRPVVLAELKTPAERQAAMRDAGENVVVITSYGTLVRDVDVVADDAAFVTMLVDEAQAVKNAATARAKALRRIRADVRIALSGTPLENHTFEVWAIMDLVAPGLFGTSTQFKARFADPIEKEDDRDRRRLLARALGPFVLRRTKQAVAPELPPKLEHTTVLTPSPEETHAYERLRKALIVDLEERGIFDDKARADDRAAPDPGQGRVQILSALTRLRLAACHRVLVDAIGDDVGDLAGAVPGTKHEAMLSTLFELKDQGHAALVFSQFVRHLDLAERFAQELGLRTLRLTGATPGVERQKLVDVFQAGGADVFFISLKAGGFGLNLTRASYVIHLDPWWNPATESQASDRAHRIGQTLPVTVTRLVMDNTIESEILKLHEHKRALADAVLDGTDVAGRLDADQLMSLLKHTRRVDGDGLQAMENFVSKRS